MFDFSFAELSVVLVVVLLVVGPDEIPVVVRNIVKFTRSIKHWLAGIKQEVMLAIDDDDSLSEISKDISSITGDLVDDAKNAQKYILDDNGNYSEVFDLSDVDTKNHQ